MTRAERLRWRYAPRSSLGAQARNVWLLAVRAAALVLAVAACAPATAPDSDTLEPGSPGAPAAPAPAATWPAPALEVLDLFQADTPFYQQSAKGRVEADASQRLCGEQSLRLTTAGSQGQLNLRADLGQPLDLSHRNLMLWLRVDGHEHLDAVTLYVGSTEMAAYAVYPVAVGGTANNDLYAHDGEWYAITVSLGDPAAVQGVVDFTAISSLQVSVSARSAGEVTVHVNGLATTSKPTRGAVTVMFDDARDTVFTHAL